MTWKSPHYFGSALINVVVRFVRRMTAASEVEIVPDEDLKALRREAEEEAAGKVALPYAELGRVGLKAAALRDGAAAAPAEPQPEITFEAATKAWNGLTDDGSPKRSASDQPPFVKRTCAFPGCGAKFETRFPEIRKNCAVHPGGRPNTF